MAGGESKRGSGLMEGEDDVIVFEIKSLLYV